jgi:nitrogen fixation/metabolism regulation signal transduction histidine kinase
MLGPMDPWMIATVVAALVAVVALWTNRRLRADLADARTAAADRQAGLEDVRAERRQSRDALADTLEVGLLDVDATLHVRRANPAAIAMLAGTAGNLVGMSLIQVFLDPAAEAVAQTAIANGTAVG